MQGYEECRTVTFAPGGDPETGERNAVVLVVYGDPEAVMEREKSRLAPHRDDGVVEEWEPLMEMTDEEMESMLGPQSMELNRRISELSAEMATLAFETFEEFPAAVDTYPGESDNMGPMGWWGLLHTLTVQVNYSLEEELQAYEYGIEHTLRNIAEYEGPEAADARLDELLSSLEEMRDRVQEGRLGP